ncbi:general secretion pathway protein GspN [Pseudomonas sp. MWU13-2105]|uniref:general secretion pathway protein GspN n=1 Tax=Pseudomonas sp. MWU13-2105 TaxID=2935074 RepID=UPI00200FB06E|nr:general secretion pathway protein GspN [Pseudomonas sp. MWU13-2105]
MKIPGRLTMWLGVLVVALAALCLALFEGLGAGIEWYPEPAHTAPPSPVTSVTAEDAPALASYAGIWERSLFNRDRKPDPAEPLARGEHDTQSLAGFSLNGIAISADLHKALFKTKDGKSLSVAEGQTLPNGWRIERITAQSVSLSFKSSQQELSLPVLKLPATAVH